MAKRFNKLMNFISFIEKMKLVERIPCLSDKLRRENDAEHSWHLAMMVLIVKDDLGIKFNAEKAIKIALIHDLIEIYTGDAWVDGVEARKKKKIMELKSAKKIFSTLPADLKKEFSGYWKEYETGKTTEAKVVKALDKICYPLQYSLSNKIVVVGPESNKEKRREYAVVHTKFNKNLTKILDYYLKKVDRNKRLRNK